MKIGVPKEIKIEEYRISMTPEAVAELIDCGHEVFIEKNAGVGSGFLDEDYLKCGAVICEKAKILFDKAEMIVKVKEPIKSEYGLFKEGQILFTYLHLAADKAQTEFLLERKITAFAYETLSLNKRLPLLEPMSEVAGKMAPIMAGIHLGSYQGGSGILMSGVNGTFSAKVLILGGGIAGKAAAEIAAGLGAKVSILDINVERLSYLKDVLPANVEVLYSNKRTIEILLPEMDVLIGTVLIPGAKAPKLITTEMLKVMKKGSVLVDVSIDQGGCFESSHATTHSEPTFIKEEIVHYCVANMPGAYPRTSTYALTYSTLEFVKSLAKEGISVVTNAPMRSALNTYNGELYNSAVAEAHGFEYKEQPDFDTF
ncbi:MAG: alanine dehydrogenase [Sulfurimonas sp.]|nr:alanine dehydrogenase [Sulfurimonas sp.]